MYTTLVCLLNVLQLKNTFTIINKERHVYGNVMAALSNNMIVENFITIALDRVALRAAMHGGQNDVVCMRSGPSTLSMRNKISRYASYALARSPR